MPDHTGAATGSRPSPLHRSDTGERPSAPLVVSCVQWEGWSVASVEGELDLATGPVLRAHLDERLTVRDGRVRIIVDLTHVTFCDPAGLGVLVGAHRRARQQGHMLRLVCPQGRVLRFLRLTRVHPRSAGPRDAGSRTQGGRLRRLSRPRGETSSSKRASGSMSATAKSRCTRRSRLRAVCGWMPRPAATSGALPRLVCSQARRVSSGRSPRFGVSADGGRRRGMARTGDRRLWGRSYGCRSRESPGPGAGCRARVSFPSTPSTGGRRVRRPGDDPQDPHRGR